MLLNGMALNTAKTAGRLAQRTIQGCRGRPLRSRTPTVPFSTCPNRRDVASEHRGDDAPVTEYRRWAKTPERMKAPFSPHITVDPRRSIWWVNEDPARLDTALNNLLGSNGARLLPEELKWLAVTHKSFDQGRRGFNDRLAYLGRQISMLEATQSIMAVTDIDLDSSLVKDIYHDRRKPLRHRELDRVDHLAVRFPEDVFTFEKLFGLAKDTGLDQVVRWKPRKPESLSESGIACIMAGAIYGLVGAVALQKGGKVAREIVRDRLLKKLRA